MTFWEGFAYYVGVQGILAIMLGGVIGYLSIVGLTVPVELWAVFSAVMGYYFGANGKAFVSRAKGSG